MRCLVLWLSLMVLPFAQPKPQIRVTPHQVKSGDVVILTGTGFTPDRTVLSHLRRPDGTEYNPLRLRTDGHGEFLHKIDTVMLDIGRFELWAEDEPSKVTSNKAEFVVVER